MKKVKIKKNPYAGLAKTFEAAWLSVKDKYYHPTIEVFKGTK